MEHNLEVDVENQEQRTFDTPCRVSFDSTRLDRSNCSVASHLSSSSMRCDNRRFEYYAFEWFWILIVVLFLDLSAMILLVLSNVRLSDSNFTSVLSFGIPFGMALACNFILWFWYACFFVTLSMYHEAIGTFLERYFRITRKAQRKGLSCMAFCYVPICLAVTVLAMLSILS